MVARHESLRTRLVTVDGAPVQMIDPPRPVRLDVVPVDGDDGLAAAEAREATTPFDLSTGPLLRLTLLRLGADDHALLVTVHHSVFDGWSMRIFIDELTACYAAEAAGAEPVLAPLPVQFADYAVWERGRLEGEVLEELCGYWRETLDGLQTMALPTDRPRPALQSVDGGLATLPLGPELAGQLRVLAQASGTTLFVVLLSAVQVLLHRYSGQDDIAIGTASANRSRPELATMIGYLVNTLVARGDLSGDPTFDDLLLRTQERLIGAYSHQDLPFARLVEALKVERDPSRPPLFQTGFTVGEGAAPDAMGDLGLEIRGLDIKTAKFDLNFFVDVSDDDMRADLSYATALFDADTADQMLRGLRSLLEGIVADPGRRLSELPVMPAEEWHREVHDWNDTAADYPVMCLHERFEQQVARHPDEPAAVFGDERWSYARLDAEANRIARRLRDLGVSTEVLVGVAMQPSLRRLAGILGILKAGGGYVPLDPALPAERLTYMIEDADVPVILTDAASEAGLPAISRHVVSLDREWAEISRLEPSPPGGGATPSDVAYVIYTSGSTGRPKGVVVEHAQVVNFAFGMIERWSLGPGDRILQFASLNFDVSAMDMFLTLLSGATAVFGDRPTLLSPPRLAELMRAQEVSFACLPPAVVSLLGDEPLPDLRVLISAGEALSSDLLRAWLRPGLTFCNGYGPTEAAIGATLMPLDGTALPPPIGRPMPNYRAYVLDTHLHPVPPGVVGELHLGGACVTRGYLNNPDLTAARFVADPFVGGGARMYKTGDLVRRSRDGNITFVGRIDGQVKIRGLRVELGEIETVLTASPGVLQAVVVVRDDAAGEKQLVGYLRVDGPISVADVRQRAALQLPGYMIPAHLLVLDEFPLTNSGKIDQAALPAPEALPDLDTYRAPTTMLEAVLVDLVGELLSIEAVGVDDSFFDLGGNSLQAMRLITQLRDELAVDADVTAIFLAPTPGQLAAHLRDVHGIDDAELDDVDFDVPDPSLVD
jgi:amino acid adenylation domain-containing protein